MKKHAEACFFQYCPPRKIPLHLSRIRETFLLTKSGVYVIIKAKEKKTRNIMAVYRCKRCKTASDCGPDAEYCVCRMCGKRQKLPRSFKKLFSPGYDAEKAAKRKKRIKTAVILSVIFGAVFSVLLFSFIIPEIKYGKAVRSYDSGDYEQALAAFRSLKGYRDSYDQIDKCKEAIKEGVYQNAKALYGKGEYEEALKAFKPLNGYKDSGDYIAYAKDKGCSLTGPEDPEIKQINVLY